MLSAWFTRVSVCVLTWWREHKSSLSPLLLLVSGEEQSDLVIHTHMYYVYVYLCIHIYILFHSLFH